MLKRLIQSLRTDVSILDGLEASTNKNLKIIFAGDKSEKAYIKKIAFNDNCQEILIGKKFFFELFYLLMTNKYNCLLAILECPFFYRTIYQSAKDFYIPSWVASIVEIPIIATHRSFKENLRKMRKNKLEYLISTKPEDIYDFYYNMYLPTVQTRHQERGTIQTNYDAIMQKVNDGVCELLLVLKERLTIAGGLIIKDKKLKLSRVSQVGIRDGKDIYLKARAQPAIYYFSSKYLEEKGFKEMGMGWSRSFLNDGVLHFKNQFNQRLIAANKKCFIFKFLSSSNDLSGLKSFLVNNPFIYRKKGRFFGAVFIPDDKQLSSEDLEKFKKLYDISGLSDLKIFQCNNSDGIFSELTTINISQNQKVIKK